MAGMWPMMKNFLRDWRAYHGELRRQDAWIRKFGEQKGYSVNPRWMVYTNLRLWLADSERMYGRRYCPCFEPTGDPVADKKLICPCAYLEQEVRDRGWCHCTLFGREDLTPADYKRAEGQLMDEYRNTPLTWVEGALDTRDQHRDELRGLPVPDAIHQVKRALAAKGLPLSVIVDTNEESEHLARLAQLRGYACVHRVRDADGVLVTLS